MKTKIMMVALAAGLASLTGCGPMTPEKAQALMAISGQIQSNTNAFLAGQQQVIANMGPAPQPVVVYSQPQPAAPVYPPIILHQLRAY
jgi:hypothetical protein